MFIHFLILHKYTLNITHWIYLIFYKSCPLAFTNNNGLIRLVRSLHLCQLLNSLTYGRELFIHRKAMVPYVQLSINCRIGFWYIKSKICAMIKWSRPQLVDNCIYGTIAFPCIKNSLLMASFVWQHPHVLLCVKSFFHTFRITFVWGYSIQCTSVVNLCSTLLNICHSM